MTTPQPIELPPGRRHGTRSGYKAGCRCQQCAAAERAYKREYWYTYARHRTGSMYGPRIDAATAREHLTRLLAAGMSVPEVADAAGVSRSTVNDLRRGRTRKTAARTAQRILRVQQPTRYTAVGLTRRVQALHALGWTVRAIAADSGLTKGTVLEYLHGRVTQPHRDVAHRLLGTYDRLSMSLPDGQLEQIGITRARRLAVRRGWVPPLGWDDEQIDNPSARPPTAARTRGRFELDDLLMLIEVGETFETIQQRLRVNRDAIEARLRRAGRHDLVTVLYDRNEAAARQARLAAAGRGRVA